MLITYADSMGINLNEMGDILKTHFKDDIEGAHILLFFLSPSGRVVLINYEEIDVKLGTCGGCSIRVSMGKVIKSLF